MIRRIWFIADDYAQAAAIDQGIVQLGQQGRLSGTSVMVTSPRLPQAAEALLQLPQLLRGLHFNLTHDFGTQAPVYSLVQIWRNSYLRLWQPVFLRQQWHAQFDQFEQAFAQPPDYIDGHQHIHQLPGIRDALLKVLNERYGYLLPVRRTHPQQFRGWKAWIIDGLGGRSVPQQAAMNTDFAGVYDFVPEHFAPALEQWLKTVSAGGLIMCHPGYYDAVDVLRPSRTQELKILTSSWFEDCCVRYGVVLGQRKDWSEIMVT